MKYNDQLTPEQKQEVAEWVQWKTDTISMPFAEYLEKYEDKFVPPHIEDIHQNSPSIEAFELRLKRFLATGSWSMFINA